MSGFVQSPSFDATTLASFKESILLDELLGINYIMPMESPGASPTVPNLAEQEVEYVHTPTERRPSVDVVRDAALTTYPYQSVGKLELEIYDHENKKMVLAWATAFYIGESRIMTVAHAFFLQSHLEWKNTFFIPSMIDKDDCFGEHYGVFKISEGERNVAYIPHQHFWPMLSAQILNMISA